MQVPRLLPPRHRVVHHARLIAVILVVVMAVGFVAATFRFTTVDVTVLSNQTTATVTYTFTVDGQVIGSGSLEPGHKAIYQVPFAWWFVNCEPHAFVATGSAGEPFPGSGALNLVVCAGSSYGTALFV
jgi:hypothetical protein